VIRELGLGPGCRGNRSEGMARTFQYSIDRRIVNRLIIWLLRFGLAPDNYYLLTVRGRKTGKPHSIPVSLVQEGDKRWLVAPYGEVDWVKNARASGMVRLSRRSLQEDLAIRELPVEEAAPVLKKYLKAYPITRDYFEATVDSPLEAFEEEAKSRPVFELIKTGTL
jgi:deazaflavin-dependent oxidoreductase (nitroreductase family)